MKKVVTLINIKVQHEVVVNLTRNYSFSVIGSTEIFKEEYYARPPKKIFLTINLMFVINMTPGVCILSS